MPIMSRDLWFGAVGDGGPGHYPAQLRAIPVAYRKPGSRTGTVVRLDYDTYESFGYETDRPQPLRKTCYVYLPYGYDETQRYNVAYDMHGGWCDETTHIGTDLSPNANKNVLDHAIADGLMQPLIVVFPTYNNTSREDSGDYHLALRLTRNYHHELVGDLMPTVESRFSTYATDVTPEGLAASRDHRAFIGFSMGSVTTWHVFEHCLDYFRYFAPSSGNCSNGAYWDGVVRASGHAPQDFFLICGTGTRDFAGSAFARQIEDMSRYPSFALSDNERDGNMTIRIKRGGTHGEDLRAELAFNVLCWLWNHDTICS